MDDDYSKDLNMMEFRKAVKDYRLKFTEKDADNLFRIFDRDQSGMVNYDEFLRTIRVILYYIIILLYI